MHMPDTPAEPMPQALSNTVITAITPSIIAEILKATGYRANVVERDGVQQVQSAAQGLGFFLGFGNAVPNASAQYVDFSFHCWITIQDELPAGLVESWNQSMRFARLFRQQQLLVLTMDVMVAGGVTEAFLCAQCELWDRVIADFIRHIKRPVAAAAAAADSASE